jgi:hypothetical protein
VLLAAGATVGAFVSQTFFGSTTTSVVALRSADPAASSRIAECMLSHQLRATRVSTGIGVGGIAYPANAARFRRCDWPPLPETAPDGYSEVRVKNFQLPRPNAAPYNNVARFRAPCEKIDVSYVLDHMFSRQFVTRRLQSGKVYVVEFNESRVAIQQLARVPDDATAAVPPPVPDPPTFSVLYSGHFALFDAHCAFGRAPS